MAVEEYGVGMVNDVSEGGITGVVNTPLEQDEGPYPSIFRMVARLGVPYILMSVKNNLEAMIPAFAKEVNQLHELGVKDIILDPGFGFGKSLDENYALLAKMEQLQSLDLPLLVGVSRKSMIFRLLDTDPSGSLNGTSVIHTIAVEKGANILRVHDVKEAVEVVKIVNKIM